MVIDDVEFLVLLSLVVLGFQTSEQDPPRIRKAAAVCGVVVSVLMVTHAPLLGQLWWYWSCNVSLWLARLLEEFRPTIPEPAPVLQQLYL